MPAFTYTARALNGDLRTATIEAPSRDDVVAQLRKQRLNVVKIDEAAVAKKKKTGKRGPGRPRKNAAPAIAASASAAGIENLLRHFIPEVQEVRPV